jgi:hypothetical protein
MHPRPMTAAAPAPRPVLTYRNQTFSALPGRELLELVGVDGVLITGCRFRGGTTSLRLNGCSNVTVELSQFDSVAGPPDPDGQSIQVIRPAGPHTIDRCQFTASPQSEDLVNVFADEACAGSVLITGCNWIGRGRSDSCTSLCMDGPFCPPVTVRGGRMQGARCAVTVAGGRGHVIDGVRLVGCENRIYVYAGYGTPPGVRLNGYAAADVLIGDGMVASAVFGP